MKAVLLVGGLGTRLRSSVPSLPKALASLGGRPFLELLVMQLRRQRVRQLVMCTGYMAEQIEEVFGDGSRLRVRIDYSKESSPLGTAGALRLAQHFLEDESEFLLLNGDSFFEIDFNELVAFHRNCRSLTTIAVTQVQNASRYGTVERKADGRVLEFAEKTGENAPGVINAGVYVIDRSMLTRIPEGPSSLERDVLPRLLEQRIYAFEQKGLFIDIGTPDDYGRAEAMYDRLSDVALYKY